MNPAPLSYSSPDSARFRRPLPWRTLLAVVVVLALILMAPTVPVRQVEGRIDPVTRSITRKTVWPFGITSGSRVEISPLEMRLRSRGIPWTASSRPIYNTRYTVFGGPTCFECASAPPVYQLGPALTGFVAASTDAELREFVRVMQSGTEAQQEAAVKAAKEKGFRFLSAGGPGV